LRYNGKEGKSITILEGVNTSTDAQKAFYFKTAEIFKDEKVSIYQYQDRSSSSSGTSF
uniref:Uncharacterized protein n=1 Tax=Parascaris univalens TaxID=6257 RepID=A0A915A4E9_PARUN